MQVDPVYAKHPSPNGSWLGAVEFVDGNILLLGALGLDSHVQLRDGTLQGWYENGPGESTAQQWFVGFGAEIDVFHTYAQLLGQKFGLSQTKTAQRVWCSWYSLYTAIDENILHTIFDGLGDLPFDVLQVDDGWQTCIGDWQGNTKFPSGMKDLAEKIKTTGRKAGLWLAPLLVVPSSTIYREHPDWLLRDAQGKLVSAGFNWGENLFALDTTHPQALNWLAILMKQVRAWGYDYIKLDFLYAGALPGKRHIEMPREAAYRHGLCVIREALGQDAYFLTCGAPIIPSLGLCDGMRIGPDVGAEWESYRDAVLLSNPATPGAKNAIRTTINRLWLAPLVQTDPDVAFFRTKETRLTPEQNIMLQHLAQVSNFKATSDLPQWLASSERETLQNFLASQPVIQRTGRYIFQVGERQVNFGPAMSLPEPPQGIIRLVSAITGWLGSQPVALKWLDKLGKKALLKIKNSL
jgi:alpha-galactosidase